MRKKKPPRDPNVAAFTAIGALQQRMDAREAGIDPQTNTLPGNKALAGAKGGEERAKRLSPEARAEIAKKAARSRWKKATP